MLPQVTGVSELQRKGKRALEPITTDKDQIVMLSDRNHVFGVVMSVEHYEQLLQLAVNHENDFWLSATQTSLDFWNHPSNDAYEKYL